MTRGGDEQDFERAAALLAKWQTENDRDALDELLRLEITALTGRVRGFGRDIVQPQSVSDVVQDAVVRILNAEHLPQFEDPRVFSAYLWRAAQRLLLDRLRRRKRRLSALDEHTTQSIEAALAVPGGQSAVERQDEAEQVEFGMALLADEQREILHLHYRRKLDSEAIGQELGIGAEAARQRVRRAKLRLAEKLKGWRDLVEQRENP